MFNACIELKGENSDGCPTSRHRVSQQDRGELTKYRPERLRTSHLSVSDKTRVVNSLRVIPLAPDTFEIQVIVLEDPIHSAAKMNSARHYNPRCSHNTICFSPCHPPHWTLEPHTSKSYSLSRLPNSPLPHLQLWAASPSYQPLPSPQLLQSHLLSSSHPPALAPHFPKAANFDQTTQCSPFHTSAPPIRPTEPRNLPHHQNQLTVAVWLTKAKGACGR